MNRQSLKDLVQDVLDDRWETWAKEHPHLAAALDRTQLLESTVTRLETDSQLQRVLRDAEFDHLQLHAAVTLLRQVQRIVGLLLPG